MKKYKLKALLPEKWKNLGIKAKKANKSQQISIYIAQSY